MNALERMKENLRQEIREAVLRAGLATAEELPEVVLEVPREKSHGDLATNMAMQLARIAKKNPRQIAEIIVAGIHRDQVAIQEIHIAGPGFINFFIDRSQLREVLVEIGRAGDTYGRSSAGNGEKVLVEFVSVNPTGSLHLGHARGAAIGDVLCNVMEAAGYDVTREYYINDAGNQIRNMTLSLEARYQEALGQKVDFPEDGYRGQDIVELGKQLAEEEGDRLLRLDEEERLAWIRRYGLDRLLEGIQKDLQDYRVQFDSWFSEQSLHDSGSVQGSVEELTRLGQTYEQEGALWLKSSQFGDDKDRVLVKQDGSYTYITPDIAYHRNKYNRGFDRIVDIFGADTSWLCPPDESGHGCPGFRCKQDDFPHHPDGEAVPGWRIGQNVQADGEGDHFGGTDGGSRSGCHPILFCIQRARQPLGFRYGSGGFPIQRESRLLCTVCSRPHQQCLSSGREQGIEVKLDPESLSALQEEAELDLLQKLAEFPEEIATAAQQMTPHRIVRYLYDLATQLQSYYNAYRVIQKDERLTRARLSLLGVAQVLKSGLQMIGVSAPEQM